MPPQLGTVTLRDAQIIFRNFTGKESQYNREGDRNFGVKLPPEIAEAMANDGWNVKVLKPREDDEDDVEQPWISVSVNYEKGRPPKVTLVTQEGRKKTPMTAETIEQLDWADITRVDLILRPYFWEVSGNTGIKAYLQTMFVTINEDELEAEYGALGDAQTPIEDHPLR
jgi:hypothetical protein